MNCPICQKALPPAGQPNPFRPFCSERCKTIDLAKWLDGSYAVAGEPVEPESLPAGSTPSDDPRSFAPSPKGRR